MRPIIKVENLSKEYSLGAREAPYGTLRESLTGAFRNPLKRFRDRGSKTTLRALSDVSFEIAPGDVVGVIGHNGAGKSTLLKVLSRVAEPTSGRVELYGRVGSLLEVGTGFHPELTGRENTYLNGAILGMKRSEIQRRFDEIVEFAEVGQFLDTPVKRYSSGMYLRLAFAVAAHLEPEILVVDEVLAVGDVAFQKRCLGKMNDVARTGRTVILVSHNMAAIENLCQRAFLMEKGRLALSGKTREVVDAYLSSVQMRAMQELNQRMDRKGSGNLKFTDVAFLSDKGEMIDVAQTGQDLKIALRYSGTATSLSNVSVHIGVFTLGGQCMVMLNNDMVGANFERVPSSGELVCTIPRLPLTPGQYYLSIYCEVNGVLADWVQQAAHITVEAGDFFQTGRLPPASHGGVLVQHDWNVS